MSKKCSVIILAAGFSSRMNYPKFALRFNESTVFLQKIVQEYTQFGCKKIISVLNPSGIRQIKDLGLKFPKEFSIVMNKYPEKERFFSLQTGLKALNRFKHVFIQNVDNPFIDQKTLNSLFKAKDKADCIVPVYRGKGGHPILINKSIAEDIINHENEEAYLRTFLQKYSRFNIDSENHIHRDMNTVKDYKEFFK